MITNGENGTRFGRTFEHYLPKQPQNPPSDSSSGSGSRRAINETIYLNKSPGSGRTEAEAKNYGTHRVLLVWLWLRLEPCSAMLVAVVVATAIANGRTWVQVWVMGVRTWVSLECVWDPAERNGEECKFR